MSDQRNGRGRGIQHETVALPRDVPRQRKRDTSRARGAQRNTVAVNPAVLPRVRGVFTAGIVTCVWNILVVLLPIIMAVIASWWVAGRPGGVADVLRTAGALWLLGHGTPLGVAGLPIELPPLLLTAVIFWRLSKAGAHTIRAIRGRDFPAVRVATLSVVASYTVLATAIAFFVDSGDIYAVAPWQVAIWAALLACVASSLGALSESGGGHIFWHRLPVWLRRGMRTGMVSMVAILAAGALLVGAALAVHGEQVAATVANYSGGALGLAVLSLLFLPSVAVWGAAYLLGPGFAVGAGTEITVMHVDILPLPVFPLFAAIPHGPLSAWGTALWGVPLVIGSVQGVILALRSADLRLSSLLWSVFTSGLTVFVIAAVASFLASGALGNGQLAHMGPHIWPTAGAAGAMVVVAVLVGAVAGRALGAKRSKAP